MEFAAHMASGALDALVADAVIAWGSFFELTALVRRRNECCVVALFTDATRAIADEACVGKMIDLNVLKDSAGYLQLPAMLDRIAAMQHELVQAKSTHPATGDIESTPVPGFVLDAQGRIRAGNTAFEQVLGLPRYRYVGERLDRWMQAPDLSDAWTEDRFRGSARESAFAMDVTIPSGRTCGTSFRMAAWPLSRMGAAVGYWHAVLVANQLLVSATSPTSAGQPATVPPLQQALSHDLQQPLQVMVRQASWLMEKYGESLAADARESVQHIYTSSLRMQEMLDGVMALYRIGQTPAKREELDLAQVVRQALEGLSIAIEDSAATIEIGTLPTVSGNRAQLVQLFQNLVANGIKFCRDRLPRIRISSVAADQGHRIRVEDNGIGIAPEDTSRIFELYQRLHGEDEFPGTGVGLALCKRIMESHGGRISVESAPGKGSAFILDFPAR